MLFRQDGCTKSFGSVDSYVLADILSQDHPGIMGTTMPTPGQVGQADLACRLACAAPMSVVYLQQFCAGAGWLGRHDC